MKTPTLEETQKTFFPPADASEAMSNWVKKPQEWMEYCSKSDYRVLKFTAKFDWAITRVTTAPIASGAAMMDCFYQGLWLSIKTGSVIVRPLVAPTVRTVAAVVKSITGHPVQWRSDFAEDITAKHLKTHAYKFICYAVAVPGAFLVGLASPLELIDQYKKHDLIVYDKEKKGWEYVLDKVHKGQEFVLNKIDHGKEFVLEKVHKGTEFVLKHRVKAGAVGLAAVSGAVAFVLNQVL
ncbi:MAG: hypothetical protein Q8K75_10055 [Chlamydiales bacterium]|nr:hypothetical protein [Chlamydiales bacterium]